MQQGHGWRLRCLRSAVAYSAQVHVPARGIVFARVLNLSTSGCLLHLSTPVRADETIQLTLHLARHGQVRLVARVVRVVQLWGGQYGVGLCFQSVNEAVAERMMTPVLAGAVLNRA
jgi:hypothetical protein